MKRILIFLFITTGITFNTYSQANTISVPAGTIRSSDAVGPVAKPPEKTVRYKRPPGLILKNVGTALTFGSFLVVGLGALIYNTRPSVDQNSFTIYTTQDYKDMGALVMVDGAAMFITGLVLWGTGASKMHTYQQEQRKLSFDIRGTRGVIRYRF